MATGKFKCAKCDRSFSMAAHLARHKNTIHSGGSVKAAAPAKVGRRTGRRLATGATSTGVGAGSLIGQMRAYQSSLLSQRNTLESQIAGIESAIGAIGGIAALGRPVVGQGPGRKSGMRVIAPRAAGRPKLGRPVGSGTQTGSLKDNIVKVLRQSGKGLTPREIATAVKASGYSTKSSDLSKAVSNALPELKMVKRVGRGVYRA